MKNEDIIRAWKDDAFRESLSLEEQALLPDNPAGLVELDDQDLFGVAGGEIPSTPICGSISIIVTALLCASWLRGGTCDVGTLSCCN